jgi:hypothetical protein
MVTENERDKEGAWGSMTGSRRSSTEHKSAGVGLPRRESDGFERRGSRRGGLDLVTWSLAPAGKQRRGGGECSGRGHDGGRAE